MARGGSWWLVVARGGSWWLVVARGSRGNQCFGTCWLVVALGRSWLLIVACGGSCVVLNSFGLVISLCSNSNQLINLYPPNWLKF